MARVLALVLSFCIPFLILSNTASADGAPSEAAKDMPGALGTFEFKPSDWQEGKKTWWKDTDGVDPGKAGCHVATDADGKPTGRAFSEACLDDVTLVESNPEAGTIHGHENDTGHPDKFDCNAWCVGQGASKGMCKVAPAPPCEQMSAMCVCK